METDEQIRGMKTRKLLGAFLVFGLIGTVLLALLRAGHERSAAAAGSAPPVARLHAYAATNAPKTANGALWSTNQITDPKRAAVMQQVVSSIRAKQTNHTPAKAPTVAVGFRDTNQAEALRRLQKRVGASLQVYLRAENNTPNQLKGSPLAKAESGYSDSAARDETTVKKFLADNAALFLLDAPSQELRLANRQLDDLGGSVLRFTQQYRGLTVWPAEIGVHLNAAGDVDLVDCAYVPTPANVAIEPKLSVNDSAARARDAVHAGADATIQTPELVIYGPLDQPAKLAWKMNVSVSLNQAWWVVIDAQNGDTLATISRVMNDSVSGSGVDLLGETRLLNVWRDGATFFMIDTSKMMFNSSTGNGFIETDDATNQTESQILPNNTLQNIYCVTSTSANTWSNPDAVSAAYNLSQTYDYWLDRFNRNSYNDSGSNIFAVVRIGGLANAFWNDIHSGMFLGDADRYAGSLDVIGHEFTHGVVHSIGSHGVLLYKDQSGALNEAFADIFGEMTEARTKGTNDWLIGSQLRSVIRSMSNPAAYSQPEKMSQYVVTSSDSGGVHINSGIINHAYYLLAAGLKGAIGNRAAERIFYRCLTVSLKPFSQFIDARLGCVAAAEALFGVGSQQALKTAEAFDVVELYAAPASAAEPTNVNAAVSAPDSYMFVRWKKHWDLWPFFSHYSEDIYRKETAQGDSSNGSTLVNKVKLARPAVSGDGAKMLFVGEDEDLYAIETAGSGFTNLNHPGLVHSIAISPQGNYAAFVFNAAPGIPTNQIVILDLQSGQTSTVDLVMPVSDGPPLNNISYADALSFSPDGKLLIYDALSQLRGPDGHLRKAWSIFGLDMTTLQQRVVVPTEDQFDIGNPCFSRTSDRFVVFDARYTNGISDVLTLDLYDGALGVIGVSYNGLGYPVFNGDDTKVFFADEDLSTTSGRSVYVQRLSTDKLGTSGSRSLAISDAKLAVIYRRGAYPDVNTAPSVTITAPSSNAVFTEPATVTVSASANDIDGSISRVEFYSGDRLLRTETARPFSMIWSDLPAGVYTVYARAYDNQGASATTAPLRFTVKPPAQAAVINRVGAPGFEFALSLPQAGLYRLEASTNLVDWVSLGSFLSSTNFGYLDSSVTNYPQRFYRAVLTP
jgi:Zn-dependent metalloprotease